MSNRKTILVTGSDGLAGSAIRRLEDLYPQYYFFFATRRHCDLRKEEEVNRLLQYSMPDYILHTAASVGGIGGNLKNHGRFFRDNILMNTHLIHAASECKVEKLIAFSSVCAYPDDLRVLQEDRLHEGKVFASNYAYGYAKRMVDVQIQAYKDQYGISNYTAISFGNIYGISDLYNIDCGHVIPVLLHKLYLAKKNNTKFSIWGDGQSLREFMYIDDAAKCCLDLFNLDEMPQRLLITGKKEHSIKEVVDLLVKIADFPEDMVEWQLDKPNGQRSRPSDKTLFNQYFPNFQYTSLEEGLKRSWDWFNANYEVARK